LHVIADVSGSSIAPQASPIELSLNIVDILSDVHPLAQTQSLHRRRASVRASCDTRVAAAALSFQALLSLAPQLGTSCATIPVTASAAEQENIHVL